MSVKLHYNSHPRLILLILQKEGGCRLAILPYKYSKLIDKVMEKNNEEYIDSLINCVFYKKLIALEKAPVNPDNINSMMRDTVYITDCGLRISMGPMCEKVYLLKDIIKSI